MGHIAKRRSRTPMKANPFHHRTSPSARSRPPHLRRYDEAMDEAVGIVLARLDSRSTTTRWSSSPDNGGVPPATPIPPATCAPGSARAANGRRREPYYIRVPGMADSAVCNTPVIHPISIPRSSNWPASCRCPSSTSTAQPRPAPQGPANAPATSTALSSLRQPGGEPAQSSAPATGS
jgi:hypothetical protein